MYFPTKGISLLLHAFAWTCSVQNLSPSLNKLSPHSIKCVFVGYKLPLSLVVHVLFRIYLLDSTSYLLAQLHVCLLATRLLNKDVHASIMCLGNILLLQTLHFFSLFSILLYHHLQISYMLLWWCLV